MSMRRLAPVRKTWSSVMARKYSSKAKNDYLLNYEWPEAWPFLDESFKCDFLLGED